MGRAGEVWKYSFLISQTCRSQLTSDTIVGVRETEQEGTKTTQHPKTTKHLHSPFSMCNILSHQTLSIAFPGTGPMQSELKSILLPCRETTLGTGVKRGSGAVKEGSNSSAALPWLAKKKSFPSPCRDSCRGRVWTPGGRRTVGSPRGHSGKRLGTVDLCSV